MDDGAQRQIYVALAPANCHCIFRLAQLENRQEMAPPMVQVPETFVFKEKGR
jgi:hypothetical protein